MRRTLQLTSRIVLPTCTGKLTTLPIDSRFTFDTDKAYSLEMVFSCGEEEIVWCSSISMLADAFEGTVHEGDVMFSVNAKAQQVRLALGSPAGVAELMLPYLPLLQMMDQVRAAGFKPWQPPAISDADIALLLQEAE